MSGLLDSLKEAKGILKLCAAIACLIGAICASLASYMIHYDYSRGHMYSIALGGGCMAALALLISYCEDKANHETELFFTIIYGVLNIIAGILVAIYLSDTHDSYHKAEALDIIVPVCAFLAAIFFILDFVREVRK